MVKAIAHIYAEEKQNSKMNWLKKKQSTVATLTETDIFLLLKTISDCNDTVHMLLLDNVFHTSDKFKNSCIL